MTSGERGIAVIVAMMALLIMSALAAALVLGTSSETIIVRNFRTAGAAAYAADAVLQYALDELPSIPDWSDVLDGTTHSNLTDGLPAGERRLPDGSTVNLTELVNSANCARLTPCSDAEMNQITSERPWGANNPRWRLYAHGLMADLAPAINGSAFYVVLLVADDPSEVDGEPSVDGSDPDPGSGVIELRAEAFGPGGAHAVVDATAARVEPEEIVGVPGTPAVRLRSWRLSK